ncbi:multidrug effflux MFS transporter [Rhodoligotrophos defluvii]|uniref:multidrug effflux MFS transporter n=1 Tax=Rhodoligotrophos defluvii TaxID=2561934 RepID=UPI001EEFCBE5|nr:multidrug effflux MFS transporter [Rhodoligotrophos defluvii]
MTPLMSPTRTAIMGGLLVAMGSISMALYTPAMPALVHTFQTDPATIKLTLSVYFAGFSVAQLISGPFSDAFGRRPTTLAFFAIYIAGSLICAVTPTVDWLLAGRVLQGIGAAAGVALSRAIVRDQFTGQASARIMNAIGMTLALGPAISPTLGGILLTSFGWHAIFIAMVLYGAGLAALVVFALPETLAERDPSKLRPRTMLRNYAMLIRDGRFAKPTLVIALCLGGLYTMAAILPFVLVDKVGLTPTQFGLGMLMQSGSFLAGAMIVSQILRHRDARKVVPVGLGAILISGIAMAVVLRTVEPSFLSVMIPVGIWAFGLAFVLPATTTDALAPFPKVAGSASALMGFLQIGAGFTGTLAAALFGEPLTALATLLPIMGVTAGLIHLSALRSRKQASASSIAPAE